jgi:hypothetical protein
MTGSESAWVVVWWARRGEGLGGQLFHDASEDRTRAMTKSSDGRFRLRHMARCPTSVPSLQQRHAVSRLPSLYCAPPPLPLEITVSCRGTQTLLGMRQTGRPRRRNAPMPGGASFHLICTLLLCIACWATGTHGMTDEAIAHLRYDLSQPTRGRVLTATDKRHTTSSTMATTTTWNMPSPKTNCGR